MGTAFVCTSLGPLALSIRAHLRTEIAAKEAWVGWSPGTSNDAPSTLIHKQKATVEYYFKGQKRPCFSPHQVQRNWVGFFGLGPRLHQCPQILFAAGQTCRCHGLACSLDWKYPSQTFTTIHIRTFNMTDGPRCQTVFDWSGLHPTVQSQI